MEKYFFTFGSNMYTSEGFSLARSYVVIEAESENDAREKMFKARGDKWSFCYTEEEFSGQVEKYKLVCLPVSQVVINKDKDLQ